MYRKNAGKPEGKRTLCRPRLRREENTKIESKETKGVDVN
jgi:hypothetical protein